MRRQRQLVLFLRAPQRGAVKRRLARAIGDAAAHGFYAATSRALIRATARDRRWRTVLAVTPDAFARAGRFWPEAGAAPRMGQGPGDLGARMGHVFESLPPGPAVIVGSDIPGITPELVAEAFRRLASREAVFGPAADGGYWLVGLARRRLAAAAFPRRLFRGVRWSTPHALADTRANLPDGSEAPALPVLEDVDEALDFARAARRLSAP